MKKYRGTPYFIKMNKIMKEFGYNLIRDNNHYVFSNDKGEIRSVPKTPRDPDVTLRSVYSKLYKLSKISK
jgi:hypothetical protein